MSDKGMKRLYNTCIIIIAVLAVMFLGAIILVTIGADVGKTYATLITYPLKSISMISEVVLRMVPLTIIALGVSVAYRSGIINIGAEGQMAMGLIGFSVVALNFTNLPKPVLLPFALLTAAVFGGVWGFIPGFLKAKFEVSELLSTVMLNYIAAQLYSFCIRGPMMDPAGGGTPMSARITKAAWLSKPIKGTQFHTGLLIALVLCALVYILLWKMNAGFKMRAAGACPRAARYGGINVPKFLIITMVISGAFAGLAGGIEIAGVHHRAIEGITSGYGFAGVVVALFGGLHPVGILPAAFFFGMLLVGGNALQNAVHVPANMVQVMQGIIILVIIATKMVLTNRYTFDRFKRKFSKSGKEVA